MEIAMETHDDGVVELVLRGRLDIAGTGAIETLFAAAASREQGRLLVDMSEVSFLSSIGIRLLLMNAKAVGMRRGRMVLLNPQPGVLGVLETCGLIPLLTVRQDRGVAIAELLAAED